jgi:hypothetical protein
MGGGALKVVTLHNLLWVNHEEARICMLAGREGSYAHACCAVTERYLCPTFIIYERLRFSRMQAIGLMFFGIPREVPTSCQSNCNYYSWRVCSSAEVKKLWSFSSTVLCISLCLSCFTIGYFENFSLVSVIQNLL